MMNASRLDPEIKKWYGQKEFNSLTKNQRENLTPCVMLVHYSPTGAASQKKPPFQGCVSVRSVVEVLWEVEVEAVESA
eukprot:6049284-Amphidinium_carterae.1